MGPRSPRKKKGGINSRQNGDDDGSILCSKNLRLRRIDALTKKQSDFFDAYGSGFNALLHGTAGTGKTFLALYSALLDVMTSDSPRSRVVVVRSVVPTRDVGFLPGKLCDKVGLYELPYRLICNHLFGRGDAYDVLKATGTIEFLTTSFVRGTTIDSAVVVVDEVSNMTGHEIDSVVTRLGDACRLICCGDFNQSDLTREHERNGFVEFLRIAENMPSFRLIEFGPDDILRGALVKEYIVARDQVRKTGRDSEQDVQRTVPA